MTDALHYELTDDTIRADFYPNLYRIRAARDLPYHNVKAGDLGGYVQSTDNLIENGWVSGDSRVYGNSLVYGNGLIANNALMYGNARLGGNARLSGQARLIDYARMFGNSLVAGNSWVSSGAQVFGNAWLFGEALATGRAQVYGDARLSGNGWVSDDSQLSGNGQVFDGAQLDGYGQVSGNGQLGGTSWVSGNGQVTGPLDILTATIYTSQTLRCTLHRTTTGWTVHVGCWTGTVPQLRSMAESDRWVDTPDDEVPEARPEMLAFVTLCEARINRVTTKED